MTKLMYLAFEIIIILANISHTVMVKVGFWVPNVITLLEVACLHSWATTGILSYKLFVQNFYIVTYSGKPKRIRKSVLHWNQNLQGNLRIRFYLFLVIILQTIGQLNKCPYSFLLHYAVQVYPLSSFDPWTRIIMHLIISNCACFENALCA